MNLDKKGLMSGRRIRRCSAGARWAYAYYLLIINGYARIECDWTAIADEFVSWGSQGPSPEEIRKHFEEYSNNHLLMFYTAPGGRTWAQFDTREAWLKTFKTADDRRSPDPPQELYIGWLKEQHGESWPKYHCQKMTPEKLPNLPKSAPILVNPAEFTKELQTVSQISGNLPTGVGVGVGEGEVQNPSSAGADNPPASGKAKTDKFGIAEAEKLADLKEVFAFYLERIGRNPKINSFSTDKQKQGRVCYEVCLSRSQRGNSPSEHRKNSVELMKICVENLAASDYHMGREPGKTTAYNDWKHLFRDTTRLEFWWNRPADGGKRQVPRAPINNADVDRELDRQLGRTHA